MTGEAETEVLKDVFGSAFEQSDHDVRIEVLESVTDEEMNEDLIEIVVSISTDVPQDKATEACVVPVFQAYSRLVENGYLEFPLECVIGARITDDTIPPVGAFRISVTWIREHIYGNLSLEQVLAMTLQTATQPTGVEQSIQGWIPEYGIDWRNVEKPDPEQFPAQTPFSYWSGESVEYPPENNE